MEKRFLALRVCGTTCKILAWFFLIVGILLSFVALVAGLTTSSLLDWINLPQSGILLGVVAFLLLLIMSILLFLGVYSLGEIVFLTLAVEENTRRAAYLAQQQFLSAQEAQQAALDTFEDVDAVP